MVPLMQAYIIGTCTTAFRRWPERDFRDLAREAVLGALLDAGSTPPESIHFGNCAMGIWGQRNIRGQTVLSPLVAEGALPVHAPIVNVEAGCATGSVALAGAIREVLAGQVDVALAVGVEKTFVPKDPAKTFGVFAHGIDQRHPEEWERFFAEQAASVDEEWAPQPHRILFLDVHALQARRHMVRFGTTVEQIAAVASVNHDHGVLNDRAQYRRPMTVSDVLADKPVVRPLTRAMCAPISDGAAAVVVCSGQALARMPRRIRGRAIRVASQVLVGGRYRGIDEESVTVHAGRQAFATANMAPTDVDLVEVHDATAFCQLQHLEDLGLCAKGESGAFVASGNTRISGVLPVNSSGGLVSKGHPLAATGLAMIDELVLQLRGEAGTRQIPSQPRVGMQHNAGGLIGFDEALCSVTLLERV
jgi:acetyl-CoA acetyltransferase